MDPDIQGLGGCPKQGTEMPIIKEKADHHSAYIKITNFYILEHTIKEVKTQTLN